MLLKSQKILGISLTINPKSEILEEIQKYLFQSVLDGKRGIHMKKSPYVVVTPNPEQIVLAKDDSKFADIVNRADVKLPDGIGLIIALWFMRLKDPHIPTVKRTQGIDFMGELIRMAFLRSAKIALIGGTGKLAVSALECLQTSYVGLHGWAEPAPQMRVVSGRLENEHKDREIDGFVDQLARRIVISDTRLVFVGLGAPKQEYLIEMLKKALVANHAGPVVLMAVGGSFALIDGSIQRAPKGVQTIGLEWVWRLFQEPWRWRRQLALFRFIFLVFREQFSHT